MAEVVVEAVVGLLFENLKSIIQRELHLVWGFKADIRKLSATLSPLREVLADAEVKQIKSKAIRKWLVRLKHAAYDAQDVLDDWAIAETDRIRHQLAQSDAAGANYRAHLRLRIRGCPGVVIPKEELDALVALRGPSILNWFDKKLIHEDSTTSETRGKQVFQVLIDKDIDKVLIHDHYQDYSQSTTTTTTTVPEIIRGKQVLQLPTRDDNARAVSD